MKTTQFPLCPHPGFTQKCNVLLFFRSDFTRERLRERSTAAAVFYDTDMFHVKQSTFAIRSMFSHATEFLVCILEIFVIAACIAGKTEQMGEKSMKVQR